MNVIPDSVVIRGTARCFSEIVRARVEESLRSICLSVAAAHGATPRQVALAFLVRRAPLLTIPKAANPEHAEENAGAGEIRLSDAELASIDEAFPLGAPPRELPTL